MEEALSLEEIKSKIKELNEIKKQINSIKINCVHCRKEIVVRKCANPYFQKRYCSRSCAVVESAKRNHRSNNASKKKNPEKYRELMRRNYQKNRLYWMSRVIVRQLDLAGIITLDKKCKVCGKDSEQDKLQIHLDNSFPTKREDVKNSIKEGKIYYLCKEHRDRARVKVKQ